MPKKPKTAPHISASLDPQHIAALNAMSPGAGNQLVQILASIQNTVNKQAGHSGTIILAEQKGADAKGKPDLTIDLKGGRAGDAADAIDDTDYVTLRQARRLLPDAEDSPDVETAIKKADSCRPISLTNMKAQIIGLNIVHAVEAQREFVYVAGE